MGTGRRGDRPGDPFAALGLTAGPGLTDDDVRAAWRRVAAATHPDRADGGDPARFATAAAAYTALRTGFGRTEALADLAATPARRGPLAPGWLRSRRLARPASRTRGRPGPGARQEPAQAPGTGSGAADPAGLGSHPGQSRGQAPPGSVAGEAPSQRRAPAGRTVLAVTRFGSRVRRGRPGRLALRCCAVAAASGGTVLVAGTAPATPALITGALTWLALTARSDLAPPS